MTGKLTPARQAVTRCGWLTAWSGVAWLLLAGPAYGLSQTRGLEGLSYAALMSLAPGWLVLWCVALADDSQSRAMATLAGTVIRMVFVLAGVLAFRISRPDLGLKEFHVWVITFYFVSLIVETLLLVRSNPAVGSTLTDSVADQVHE